MDKIQLKHIVPYLPYGLTGRWTNSNPKWIWRLCNLSSAASIQIIRSTKTSVKSECARPIYEFIPILRPLTDLMEDIFSEQFFEDDSELLGDEFTPLVRAIFFLQNSTPLEVCFPYGIWELFFRHHFDVFGLIEAGLAIDINTLKNNI